MDPKPFDPAQRRRGRWMLVGLFALFFGLQSLGLELGTAFRMGPGYFPLVLSAVLLGFGLLILIGSWRMERFESMGAQLYAMPGFVPGMLGSVLLMLGTVLMLRSWLRS